VAVAVVASIPVLVADLEVPIVAAAPGGAAVDPNQEAAVSAAAVMIASPQAAGRAAVAT
jgi:hypothetical protein